MIDKTHDFIKFPHSTQIKERDAHLRLLALIEKDPTYMTTDKQGHYVFVYDFPRVNVGHITLGNS